MLVLMLVLGVVVVVYFYAVSDPFNFVIYVVRRHFLNRQSYLAINFDINSNKELQRCYFIKTLM